MAIALTLLYILTAYLSPSVLFGPLAEYHLEIIIAAGALLSSLPNLQGSRMLQVPTLAIGGISFAVFVSLLLSGWMGAAPRGLYSFFPCIFVYFLVLLNCKTVFHLRLIVLVLLMVCAFVIANGLLGIHANLAESPYLYDQVNGDGSHTPRLRGLSFINDPNDLSQVLVSLVPLMFFFYRKGRSALNLLFVAAPVLLLVVGLYLAHSRGAALALAAVILLAVRRRIGTVPALVISGTLFAGTSALSWSGGRETSVEAGSDRLDAWATGLQLIRAHPLFGVGYERFSEYYYITAHNTVVVCAAELGIVGFFFWVLFTFTTLRGGVELGASGASLPLPPDEAVGEAVHFSRVQEPTPEQRRAAWMSKGMETFEPAATPDEAEVRRLAGLMVIGLGGYLVAGWFLSRAYVMTLFLYGGMVQVLLRLARDGGFAPEGTKLLRLMRWTAAISFVLLTAVYVILRLRNVLNR